MRRCVHTVIHNNDNVDLVHRVSAPCSQSLHRQSTFRGKTWLPNVSNHPTSKALLQPQSVKTETLKKLGATSLEVVPYRAAEGPY